MDTLADFMARVLVHEGAWVIEPTKFHNDSYLVNLVQRMRHVPARISSPAGRNPYAFAERGAEGKWFLVWVPDNR